MALGYKLGGQHAGAVGAEVVKGQGIGLAGFYLEGVPARLLKGFYEGCI